MKNKYSLILGNLGNTYDRFCKGYKDNSSTKEMLAQVVKNFNLFWVNSPAACGVSCFCFLGLILRPLAAG